MKYRKIILGLFAATLIAAQAAPITANTDVATPASVTSLAPAGPEYFTYGRTTFNSPNDALLNFHASIRVNANGCYPYYYYWIGVLESGKKINYLRYRKTNDQYAFNIDSDTIDTYKNASLPIGKTRIYVTVLSSGGSYTSPVISVNVKYAMAKPSIKSIKKASRTSINVRWSKISNATGYIVYRSTGGSWKQIYKSTKNTVLSYTNKGLIRNKKYYYVVRPYKTKGNTVYGPYSSYKSLQL